MIVVRCCVCKDDSTSCFILHALHFTHQQEHNTACFSRNVTTGYRSVILHIYKYCCTWMSRVRDDTVTFHKLVCLKKKKKPIKTYKC